MKHLEQQGFILFNESFYQPSGLFVPDHELLYQFQVANAKYDAFVKTILRVYGGEIYTDFISISEKAIAEKLKIDTSVVIAFLQALDKAGIWIYKQQKDKPQIKFIDERYAVKDLPFDIKHYEGRKSIANKKLQSIQKYIQSTSECRTLVFQHYFGENTNEKCGICDNCLKEKKQMNESDHALVKDIMIKLLSVEPLSPYDLKNNIEIKYKLYFDAITKELLESGRIAYLENGKLTLI